MSQLHHLGCDAIKALSHLDFRIHAHLGLGDNMLSQKGAEKYEQSNLPSYGKYSGLHDQYHLLKLAQDCLFVRFGMLSITAV